jgi:hypothetical protein
VFTTKPDFEVRQFVTQTLDGRFEQLYQFVTGHFSTNHLIQNKKWANGPFSTRAAPLPSGNKKTPERGLFLPRLW